MFFTFLVHTFYVYLFLLDGVLAAIIISAVVVVFIAIAIIITIIVLSYKYKCGRSEFQFKKKILLYTYLKYSMESTKTSRKRL